MAGDPRRPKAVLGNPDLTELEAHDMAEVTGLVQRGAEIEAAVRNRNDGVHAGLASWIRTYARHHQDLDSEDVLRAAMRLFIGKVD